jgi:hypothetical protein
MNKIGTEDISLGIDIVKMTLKTLKGNTSCGVGIHYLQNY